MILVLNRGRKVAGRFPSDFRGDLALLVKFTIIPCLCPKSVRPTAYRLLPLISTSKSILYATEEPFFQYIQASGFLAQNTVMGR